MADCGRHAGGARAEKPNPSLTSGHGWFFGGGAAARQLESLRGEAGQAKNAGASQARSVIGRDAGAPLVTSPRGSGAVVGLRSTQSILQYVQYLITDRGIVLNVYWRVPDARVSTAVRVGASDALSRPSRAAAVAHTSGHEGATPVKATA